MSLSCVLRLASDMCPGAAELPGPGDSVRGPLVFWIGNVFNFGIPTGTAIAALVALLIRWAYVPE